MKGNDFTIKNLNFLFVSTGVVHFVFGFSPSDRYKINRQKIIDGGFNLGDYEGGNGDPLRSIARRWQHAKIYNFINSDSGRIYHGELDIWKVVYLFITIHYQTDFMSHCLSTRTISSKKYVEENGLWKNILWRNLVIVLVNNFKLYCAWEWRILKQKLWRHWFICDTTQTKTWFRYFKSKMCLSN